MKQLAMTFVILVGVTASAFAQEPSMYETKRWLETGAPKLLYGELEFQREVTH